MRGLVARRSGGFVPEAPALRAHRRGGGTGARTGRKAPHTRPFVAWTGCSFAARRHVTRRTSMRSLKLWAVPLHQPSVDGRET